MIKTITFDLWGTLLRTRYKTSRQRILEYIELCLGKEYADTIFDRTIL